MRSLVKHAATRLVLTVAGGLPLLWSAAADAQSAPRAGTPNADVQRQLEELYRRNGMRPPNMTPEQHRRMMEARSRGAYRPTQPAPAPPPTAIPVSAEAPAAAPAAQGADVGAPPPEGLEVMPVTPGRPYRFQSSTRKPSARRSPSRYVAPSRVPREPAGPPTPPGFEGTETPVEPAPEKTITPRRGFVLFGRESKKSSFLGRLFGRDKDEENVADVPPEYAPQVQPAGPPTPPIATPAPGTGAPTKVATRPPATPAPSDAVVTLRKPVEEFDFPVVESRDEPKKVEAAPTVPAEKGDNTLTIEPRKFVTKPAESSKTEIREIPDDPIVEEPKVAEKPAVEKPVIEEPKVVEKPVVEAPEEKVVSEPTRKLEPAAMPKPTTPKPIETKVARKPSLPPMPKEEDPRMKLIAQRKDRSGLKGFCPVVLRDDRRLVDAESEFAVVHKARTYYVSSADALKKFEANPEKYAPVASGHDVILLTVEGRRVEGSLEHAVWYKDRLHLFSSQKTLGRFVAALGRDPFAGSETKPASGTKEENPEPKVSTPAPKKEKVAPLPLPSEGAAPKVIDVKEEPADDFAPTPKPVETAPKKDEADDFDPAEFAPEPAEKPAPKKVEPKAEKKVEETDSAGWTKPAKPEVDEAEKAQPPLELGPDDGEEPISVLPIPDADTDADAEPAEETEAEVKEETEDSFDGEPNPFEEEDFENPFKVE